MHFFVYYFRLHIILKKCVFFILFISLLQDEIYFIHCSYIASCSGGKASVTNACVHIIIVFIFNYFRVAGSEANRSERERSE